MLSGLRDSSHHDSCDRSTSRPHRALQARPAAGQFAGHACVILRVHKTTPSRKTTYLSVCRGAGLLQGLCSIPTMKDLRLLPLVSAAEIPSQWLFAVVQTSVLPR